MSAHEQPETALPVLPPEESPPEPQPFHPAPHQIAHALTRYAGRARHGETVGDVAAGLHEEMDVLRDARLSANTRLLPDE